MDTPEQPQRVVDIAGLTTIFNTPRGPLVAVDGIDIDLHAGEALGLIGESGSGKSAASLSLTRLHAPGSSTISAERLQVAGRDVLALDNRALADLRGRHVGMIFQEPMSALNPTMRVGDQIAEALRHNLELSRKQASERAVSMLEMVRVPDAPRRARAFPHEMSGGMRQRVVIAIALCCNPLLIVADEPTTALDVTIQAQILTLIGDLCRQTGAALILVSHDFGVVSRLATRVAVMYAGQIIERGSTREIFEEPLHPYTRGLIGAMPELGSRFATGQDRLPEILGSLPDLLSPPTGCRFADRCPEVHAACSAPPPDVALREDRRVKCWLYADDQ